MDSFTTEAFTLLAFGLMFIFFRLFTRVHTLGWSGIKADDLLMIVAGVSLAPAPDSVSTLSLTVLILAGLLGRNRAGLLRRLALARPRQQRHDRYRACCSRSVQPRVLSSVSGCLTPAFPLRSPVANPAASTAPRHRWPAGQPTPFCSGPSRRPCAPFISA